MSVLVTGGAGYIGSHAAHALVELGESVVVLDDFSSGMRGFIPASAQLVEGSVGDLQRVRRVLAEYRVEAVLHFAGSISVPESVEQPLEYYHNNTANSCVLIRACVDQGVQSFVFSSTAAVYGATDMAPVTEDTPTRPVSPYGRSKLMVEWVLDDTAQAHKLRYAALRYFNVAGIDPKGRTGQPEMQAPHLIKRAAQVAIGRAECLEIYGTDYPTRDGTAVRDYIHICDLVDAHILALQHLRRGGESGIYNCGYGKGCSVLDVVRAFERVTGRALPARHAARRPGDAPFVVADSTRLRKKLGWRPGLDRLDTIVSSALDWERQAILAQPGDVAAGTQGTTRGTFGSSGADNV
jgi:UDP-glucose 4-epimerase